MKFTVSIEDRKIRNLFKFPGEYIDAYIDEKRFILFAEAPDIFVAATLSINTIQDFKQAELFRIPKSGFFNLLDDGIISFICDENAVYMSVKTKLSLHKMMFERQICNTIKLEDRLKILKDAAKYPQFPVNDLFMPSKILKNSPAPLTIEDKIAFAELGGMHLYAKTKCDNCAIFPGVLNHLIRVCAGNFDHVYNVKNCIVFSDGKYHVMINKVNSHFGSDIGYIMRQKSIYEVNVNFGQAIKLLKKARDYTDVDLNLRRRELILKSGECEYSAEIALSQKNIRERELTLDDILEESHVEVPIIRFPVEIFKNIIYSVNSKSLAVVCTKNLVRISVLPGLMLVCRKESGLE